MPGKKRLMNKVPVRFAKAVDSLAAAVEVQAGDVDAAFRERAAKVLREGETAPDVKHLMDVVVRLVKYECRELLGVDEATIRGGMGVARMRRECRRAKAEVRGVILKVRKRMVAAYGAQETAEFLGFKGRTPRNLEGLHGLAERMLLRLPGLEQPKEDGLTVDPATWVRRLRSPYERLDRAMTGLESRSWQEDGAHRAKQDVLKSFEGTYSLAVRLFEILCYLAGQKFLGDRLRPAAILVLRGGSRGADEAERAAGRWALPRSLARWMRKPAGGGKPTQVA